jgi:regulatory protein
MKILKYEKKKNGMYQVFFDNGNNVDIHEEIILKNDLLIKKEASEKEIDKMLDENKKYIAYNLAIKSLSSKMKTEKEIKEYLSKNNFDDSTIEEVIKLLKKSKYIDNITYAKAYVNDKIILSNDGPYKIKKKLIDLGIDEDSIDDALNVFDKDTQKEKIEKISNKFISTNRNKSAFMLKNKIIEYLSNLGYSKELVYEYINKTSFSNNKEIAKKEYDKIYKKLSRKYSKEELEFKVKQKMYSLGFTDYED